MKKSVKFGLWLCGAVVVVAIAALAQPVDSRLKSILILNGDNVPFFTGKATSTQTANLFELWSNPTNGPTFYVSAAGVIPNANVGIQSGTNSITNSTISNSFTVTFTSIPRVIVSASDGTTVVGATNVSLTGFNLKASGTGGIANWIAIQQ